MVLEHLIKCQVATAKIYHFLAKTLTLQVRWCLHIYFCMSKLLYTVYYWDNILVYSGGRVPLLFL